MLIAVREHLEAAAEDWAPGWGPVHGGGQSLSPQGLRLAGQRDAGLVLYPCEMLSISVSKGMGGAALGGYMQCENSAQSC